MTSATPNVALGNAYFSDQANIINDYVYISTLWDRQTVKKKRCAKRTSQAGPDNALGRLSRTEDTPFNAFAMQHEPAYLPNIRTVLLDKIYSWADCENEWCVF